MKVFIMGKRWKITVYNDKTYNKKIGEGSAGISILEDRKIYIKRSHLNKDTVAHELVHGYCHELSYVELSLDDDQVEEFWCELIAKHSEKINKDARKIVEFYTK